MSRLLTTRTGMVPILVSALVLFAVLLASCGGEATSDRADQDLAEARPSGESASPEVNSGGGAGSSEYAGANPVEVLPPVETATSVPYFLDDDGDGIGSGDPVLYEPGTEPDGWVRSGGDDCPGQYGTEQPDSDGDGVGDACDPGTSDQFGNKSDQYSDGTGQ